MGLFGKIKDTYNEYAEKLAEKRAERAAAKAEKAAAKASEKAEKASAKKAGAPTPAEAEVKPAAGAEPEAEPEGGPEGEAEGEETGGEEGKEREYPGQLQVSATGEWKISKTVWRGTMRGTLYGRDVKTFIDAMLDGNTTTAVELIAEAYGIPPGLIDVEASQIENISPHVY